MLPDFGVAVESTGLPRSVRNRRPSLAVPNFLMCALRMATRTGGMGTMRTSVAARCLRLRASWVVPVSGHWTLTSGRDRGMVMLPQSDSGRTQSALCRAMTSAGRMAE